MWALIKNGEVVLKSVTPESILTANKRHLVHYQWIEITGNTGDCELGDAYLNGKFLGPITLANRGDFNYYKYIERDVVRATTNLDYFEFLVLTTADLEEGQYRIAWAYDWGAQKDKAVFNAKLEHHKESEDIFEIFQHVPLNKHIKSSNINSVSGFKPMTLSGVNEFKLFYKSSSRKDSVSIWNARLEILRLS